MSYWQRWHFRRISQNVEEAMTLLARLGLLLFVPVVIVFPLLWLHLNGQPLSWESFSRVFPDNLFIWGCYNLLLLLPSFTYYLAARNWFVCKREVALHFNACPQIPPSHLPLLKEPHIVIVSAVKTVSRALHWVWLQRLPHLRLGRSSPFPLFQQANLLVGH